MTLGCKSHIGRVRKNNEDKYYVNEQLNLYIVADGMGGHENGALASQLAIEAFSHEVKIAYGQKPNLTALMDILNKANESIYRYQEDVAGKIMGTTLTAVWVRDDLALIAHIGDSRAYLIHQDSIQQLTNDHSYFAELARLGEFDAEELVLNGQKNVLIKALGPEEKADAQYLQYPISRGDKIVLCSDGLYNLVSNDEIKQIVNESLDLEHATDQLTHLALDRGGFDNITVVIYAHE